MVKCVLHKYEDLSFTLSTCNTSTREAPGAHWPASLASLEYKINREILPQNTKWAAPKLSSDLGRHTRGGVRLVAALQHVKSLCFSASKSTVTRKPRVG